MEYNQAKMSENFWETNLIYKAIAGSQAYGLSTPESDVDIRGICIPDRPRLIGLTNFEQWELQDAENDAVIYSLRKFVLLALKCNPNIIEILFTTPRFVLYIDDYGKQLLAQRHIFLTKQARRTFAGYAISQLRRIEQHHRWLVNPPDHQPTQEEFGGWKVDGRYEFPHITAYKSYRAALKHWQQYTSWRRNRNPERAALERQYGYDTKHATHLFRLLKMGAEILETGEVHVYRPDREWLRAVRNGLLTYDEVLDLAAEYEARLDALYDDSPLPDKPDFAAAEQLVMEMHERYLWETRRGA